MNILREAGADVPVSEFIATLALSDKVSISHLDAKERAPYVKHVAQYMLRLRLRDSGVSSHNCFRIRQMQKDNRINQAGIGFALYKGETARKAGHSQGWRKGKSFEW